jgi:hypothetical protein
MPLSCSFKIVKVPLLKSPLSCDKLLTVQRGMDRIAGQIGAALESAIGLGVPSAH